jgi:hypothetical protein
MIKYEYIYQYVHVGMSLTMIHLIIELDDYVIIQVLYCDAKEKNVNNEKKSLSFKIFKTKEECIQFTRAAI